jgi:hypothetical protein
MARRSSYDIAIDGLIAKEVALAKRFDAQRAAINAAIQAMRDEQSAAQQRRKKKVSVADAAAAWGAQFEAMGQKDS